MPVFILAGSAYLAALLVVHLIAPRLEPAQLTDLKEGASVRTLRKGLVALALFAAAPVVLHAQTEPVILEAEAGARSAADYTLGSADGVQYISINSTVAGQNPTVASRVVTFSVTFPAPGTYELYARLRVGAATFNDDSMYYGNGFGEKPVSLDGTADGGWITANGLAGPWATRCRVTRSSAAARRRAECGNG